MTTRTEPDTSTTFNYGNSAASFNIGQLASMSSTGPQGTYSETFVYDNRTRPATRTIAISDSNGTASYAYDYAYDPVKGWLDMLTYPTSTSGYRLALKYGYQNGQLQSVSDANTLSTVFWQANASNAFGQTTQETLGNGLITNRTYDAVTSWMSSLQSGPAANPTSVQNYTLLSMTWWATSPNGRTTSSPLPKASTTVAPRTICIGWGHPLSAPAGVRLRTSR